MAVDFVVDAVMTALGLEGNEFQRPTIEFYVDEVNEYLKDAGVPENVIGTKQTVGVVARGVADLWSYGAGNGKLSIYFKERAIQLASTSNGGGGGGSSDLPPVTPADDGKALIVVNGEWAAAEIPNNRLELRGEWVADEKGFVFTLPVTETELLESVNNGVDVVVILPGYALNPLTGYPVFSTGRLAILYAEKRVVHNSWLFFTTKYSNGATPYDGFYCVNESLKMYELFNDD